MPSGYDGISSGPVVYLAVGAECFYHVWPEVAPVLSVLQRQGGAVQLGHNRLVRWI